MQLLHLGAQLADLLVAGKELVFQAAHVVLLLAQRSFQPPHVLQRVLQLLVGREAFLGLVVDPLREAAGLAEQRFHLATATVERIARHVLAVAGSVEVIARVGQLLGQLAGGVPGQLLRGAARVQRRPHQARLHVGHAAGVAFTCQ